MTRAFLAAAVLAAALGAAFVLRAGRGGAPEECVPPGAGAPSWLALEPMFGGRAFRKPVQAIPDPAEPDAWWVVESEGRVLRVPEDGSREPEVVLDVRGRVLAGSQWGLQAVAPAPGYPRDPRAFVTYTAPVKGPSRGETKGPKWALESRVSELQSRDGGRTLDAASERVLLRERQRHVWHPIAGLAFGPDGMLYVGWGEGGGLSPEVEEKVLRGKILRIDPSSPGADGYAIPPDNPFRHGPYRPPVWAAGFRNPWRFSFDAETGDLWVGDVGARAFEEIAQVRAGEHHGWPWREGFECRYREGCPKETTPPVFVHSSRSLCSVIGGHVYRGAALPSLRGKYVYGDYCTRALYAFDPETAESELLAQLPIAGLAAIEVDRDGELHVVETRGAPDDPKSIRASHRVHRLVATADRAPEQGVASATLGALGCRVEGDPHAPPPRMLQYDVDVPAWDEGATARRFVRGGFRPLQRVDQTLVSRPKVFLKTLFLSGAPVETQMLAVDRAGEWGAWSFAWDEAGEDAELVTEPTLRRLADGRTWQYDTAPACFRCHSEAAGRVLGLDLRQLDDGVQLERWMERGVLEAGDPETILAALREGRRPLVDPFDREAALDDRARSLLHVRCGSCHRPGGEAGASAMDLTIDAPEDAMGLCGVAPSADFPGLANVRLVDPKRPETSLLHLRMVDEGSLAMPPGRRTADREGAALVAEWIRSGAACAARSG